jgi:hypothetical protein
MRTNIETLYRTVIIEDEPVSNGSRRNGRKCRPAGFNVLGTMEKRLAQD